MLPPAPTRPWPLVEEMERQWPAQGVAQGVAQGQWTTLARVVERPEPSSHQISFALLEVHPARVLDPAKAASRDAPADAREGGYYGARAIGYLDTGEVKG